MRTVVNFIRILNLFDHLFSTQSDGFSGIPRCLASKERRVTFNAASPIRTRCVISRPSILGQSPVNNAKSKSIHPSTSGDRVFWTKSIHSPGKGFVPVDPDAKVSVGTVVNVAEGSGEKFVSTLYEVYDDEYKRAVLLSSAGL